MSKQKNSFVLCGWRVGRNPPSVPSSICLIGEPAPPAELIGVYIPFHSAMGARFIPRPALHPGRPGEHPIIVTRYRDDDGMFSRASRMEGRTRDETDRKSTRLNSSHLVISYAVFCLKKKTL